VSKRVDKPYLPGNRGLWLKSKCLNREEFIVVGWTDPGGSRSHFGAPLSATTPTMGGCSTLDVQGPASTRRSFADWPVCFALYRHGKCRSLRHRLGRTASANADLAPHAVSGFFIIISTSVRR